MVQPLTSIWWHGVLGIKRAFRFIHRERPLEDLNFTEKIFVAGYSV